VTGFGDNDDMMRAVYLVALLAFVLAGFTWRSGGVLSAVRSFAIWTLAIIGLVAVYAYRTPILAALDPVLGELAPGRAVIVEGAGGDQEFRISRGIDGHFHVDADANGAELSFLVDTGATSTALSLADAERAGIDIEQLRFDRPVRTANGITFYASAELDTLLIGPHRIDGLSVAVMPDNTLSTSLLGLNVLDRFASYRIEGDRMYLSP
jgi:aspartyl protease family protein